MPLGELPVSELRPRLARVDGAGRTIEHAHSLLSGFWKRYDAASYEQRRALMGALTTALGGVAATKQGLIWTQAAEQSLQYPSDENAARLLHYKPCRTLAGAFCQHASVKKSATEYLPFRRTSLIPLSR